MNLKTESAAAAAVLLSTACAAYGQAATLSIQGRITSTPCTISVGSVAMGEVPISEFSGSSTPGQSYWKTFTVTLQDCEMSTLQAASLRFNGTTAFGDATILALTPGADNATGFGVQVQTSDATHGSGVKVRMDGSQAYALNVHTAQNTFQFTSYYITAPGATEIRSGAANATATITLSYS
ncbi:fimbrial protein [Achromobacter sp. NPDC058515]|uniref:fimbrial protein n=1 Tax=Achromobacter sp. NPDC058515 TaxID=3346533 RepID=UPI003654E481